MALRIRPLTVEETETIRRLAHARTEPARRVERVRIVWLSSQGHRAPAIAGELGICTATVRFWLKRFSARRLARHRPGDGAAAGAGRRHGRRQLSTQPGSGRFSRC